MKDRGPYRIGLVPRSIKNNRQPIIVTSKKGKKRVVFKIAKGAKLDRQAVRDLVGQNPIPRGHDVVLAVKWLVRQDAIEFNVLDLGPRPKGRKGRRDLQGIVDALCDALQGYTFENDSQVSQIVAGKVYA